MMTCLICATVLIVVLLALRPLLKRTSARLRYALWALVFLRLALPFPLLSSGWSVMNVVDTPQSPAATAPVGLEEPASGNVYLESTGEEVPTIDTAAVIGPSQSPAATALPEESKGDQAVTGSVRSPEPLHIIRAIWLAGSIVVGAWFVIGNVKFALYLRKNREYYGKYGTLPVYLVEHIPTPCLAGLPRPAIYVTPEVAAGATMRSHVLAHEAAHFRHGDHIWSIARGLCLTAYWFHPLVWVAVWLSRRDCELACDETALRNMTQPERIAYGRTLLALVSAQKASPLRVATTMTAGKREMKDRVRAIAERRKTVVAALVAALLITAVAVGCTFTGAKTKESTVPMVRFSVDGTRYTPQRGTTSWNSESESFEACGIHPLAWDEALWAESTVEHDATHTRLEFDFDEPAEAILRAWPIGAPTNAAPVWEQGTVNADRYWTVKVQSGMVYELQVHWSEANGGSGTAHYGIRVENAEPDLVSPFDLKLLYADDERVAFMGPFGLCVYDLSAGELLGYCDLREHLGMNVCGALREKLYNDAGRITNYGVVLEGMATRDHRVAVHLRWIDLNNNVKLLHLDTEKTVYMDLQTGEVSLGQWDESIRLDTGLQEAFDLLGQGEIEFYTTEAIPFEDGSYGYIAVGGTADAYPIDGLFYARGDQRWELHLDLAERDCPMRGS